MSQQNVELARRAIDDWNRGEFSGAKLRLYYHPDVEWLPHRAETEGAFHGIEGMERFWADPREVFEKFELHLFANRNRRWVNGTVAAVVQHHKGQFSETV